MMPKVAETEVPELVVAILNWNGYDLTRSCLISALRLAATTFRILVVDNGSAEPEAQRLAGEFGVQVEALALPGNLGVGGGYNAAIRWARDCGAKYVLLLNNDTIVDDPMLARRLIDACGADVFAVGPMVMEANGRLFSAGGKLSWRTSQTGHRQAGEITSPGSPYPVTWIDGSCLLVSVAAACELRGFDEDFFLYWEEVDVCVRAWRQGLRCLIEPRAAIVHLGSQTARSSQIDHLMLRNAILFMRRNGTKRQNAAFLMHLFCWRIPRFVAGRVKHGGAIRETVGMVLRSVAWNIRDAARERGWRRRAGGSLDCRGEGEGL